MFINFDGESLLKGKDIINYYYCRCEIYYIYDDWNIFSQKVQFTVSSCHLIELKKV